MRVVLDTNIFVSGIHWKGDSSRILSSLLEHRFELISSQEIIDELVETLKTFRIAMTNDKIIEWVNWIVDNALIVEPSVSFDIIKDDKEDNKFLEAGVEASAEYIVSQDNHLLKLKEFQGIRIVKPEEFLSVLE